MKYFSKSNLGFILAIIGLIVLSHFFFFRIDLTSDKRFSISRQSKELMKSIKSPINVKLYLTGDLNPGFLRLKNSTVETLEELGKYSKSSVHITTINPSDVESETERQAYYENLEKRGLKATTVYEKDNDGKAIQKIVFPWIEISFENKTIPVNLLNNNAMISGEENLNISIENLEFELTDAIRRLLNTAVEKIAFLEGHGELSEIQTFEASKSLSRYFQIDRGKIESNPSVLDDYKAVIIAKPTKPFSEKDKFVLDQYLMKGGSILWLIDGVQISEESFSTTGQSPAIPYDLNLDDLLFGYGVRINPVIVEDVQSTLIPVNVAPKGSRPQYEPVPWIFSPLLLPSMHHPITKNLPPVEGNFVSIIDTVGNNKQIKKAFLLASSGTAHLLQTPASISLKEMPDVKDKNYFNSAFVPVAVSLEGTFQSAFANRMKPEELTGNFLIRKTSVPTRQIVVADGDIIRNNIIQSGDSIQTLTLGLDRYTNLQYGNNEFIINAVLYLTDKDDWMSLRNRTIPLRLLNKEAATSQRLQWQLLNVLLPVVLLLVFGISYEQIRKRKYTKIK